MENLRIILLIIGCIFVLGLYFWEVFFKKEARKNSDILDAIDDLPGTGSIEEISAPAIKQGNSEEEQQLSYADLGSLLTKSRDNLVDYSEKPIDKINTEETNDAIEDPFEKELPLHMSVKDYESSISNENNHDVFSTIESESISNETEQNIENDLPEENYNTGSEIDEETEKEIPENNQLSEDILVLYITSRKHKEFNGLLISKAADEVGMIFGHMNIFHHFGPGKLHSGQPLFSMANMYEPGSFDLGKMADLKTKGITLFMYSPASIDPGVVFELFLNTSQRIAEILDGEVLTVKNEPLNKETIKSLREKAESFSVF